MNRKHNNWYRPLLLLAFLLWQPVQAWSQTDGSIPSARDAKKVSISNQVENGLTRITFTTDNGHVIASLPAEIAPTDNIWGSVTLAPAGQTAQDRKTNFNVLKKLMVQIKPENGSPVMMAPGCSPQVVHVPNACSEIQASLYDPDDKNLYTYRLSCLPQAPANNTGDDQVTMPQVAVPKRFFKCGANTNGSPGKSACAIGGENCPLVAGSPRDQWFATPQDLPPGPLPIKFYLPDTNQVAESQVSVARPKIYADKLLKVGDKGQIKITVEGLKRGADAQLIFRNLSPQVISVGGGDYQVIPLSGK